MANEVTAKDYSPRAGPREIGQEYAEGTVDLDGAGAGSITVDLTGELHTDGMGLFGTATAGDGTATLSSVTPDSVTVDVSGGTAEATGVSWSFVLSEDGFTQP